MNLIDLTMRDHQKRLRKVFFSRNHNKIRDENKSQKSKILKQFTVVFPLNLIQEMILEKAMNQQQIQQFLDLNGGVAVVDCYATWCGPCNKISPYMQKKHEQTKIPLITIDVDQAEELTAFYEITAMPTYFLGHLDQWNNTIEKIVGEGQANVDKAYNIAASHRKK